MTNDDHDASNGTGNDLRDSEKIPVKLHVRIVDLTAEARGARIHFIWRVDGKDRQETGSVVI